MIERRGASPVQILFL
ncbi:unnamed protein product, partial [Didymodactylos carnosus]